MPSIRVADRGLRMMRKSAQATSYLTALNEFYTLHKKPFQSITV